MEIETARMIYAKPQANGNSRDDFVLAYKALTQAITAVEEATSLLGQNVLHGRNYQHLADGAMVRETDVSEVSRVMAEAMKTIGNVRRNLVQQIDLKGGTDA